MVAATSQQPYQRCVWYWRVGLGDVCGVGGWGMCVVLEGGGWESVHVWTVQSSFVTCVCSKEGGRQVWARCGPGSECMWSIGLTHLALTPCCLHPHPPLSPPPPPSSLCRRAWTRRWCLRAGSARWMRSSSSREHTNRCGGWAFKPIPFAQKTRVLRAGSARWVH
eukprot:357706-Chlamydomonas_euryale.AAC.1